MIRVVIAEDHALFRSGLKQILSLQKNLSVEGEAGSAEEAFSLCRELNPDLLLLDISLPGMTGIEAIPKFRQISPHIKILIISMHGTSEYVRSAFKAGANGYLLKTADINEFFLAIQTILNDNQYISTELTTSVLNTFLHNDEEDASSLDVLTAREKEILVCVAKGLSNKEIASELNIAEKTVITHRTNFMRKLSLHNVREIIMFAMKHNLISVEQE